ncbi:regulatory protein, luxR family [Paenibacillus algorifonticola]|uniref:Regulatory protein, luxR family n=1 Tax=Paenibacillus algorifonticola TaxID=684063 RepID=A0A1I2FFP6_9BACL|nr:helix-turn-helix transcriptional regulator [Paenibacillus algorifonticola]SFF04075.1 regulatory protein, luxR family [Paenibacillus algorifonticola]
MSLRVEELSAELANWIRREERRARQWAISSDNEGSPDEAEDPVIRKYSQGRALALWTDRKEEAYFLLFQAASGDSPLGSRLHTGLSMVEHIHFTCARGRLQEAESLIERYRKLLAPGERSFRSELLDQVFGFIHLMRSAETGALEEVVRETVVTKDFEEDVPAVGPAKSEAVFLLFNKHAYGALLHFLFRDFPAALRSADKAFKRLPSADMQAIVPELRVYDTIAISESWDKLKDSERARYKARLGEHHSELQSLAAANPKHYAIHSLLVAAELQRLFGQQIEALRLYDQAVIAGDSTRHYGYAALTLERMALMIASGGATKIADTIRKEAGLRYRKWGAAAKVRALNRTKDAADQPPGSANGEKSRSSSRRPTSSSSIGSTTKPKLLSLRELEVLEWIARGLSNSEIASELGLVTGTVKNHIKSIYEKLGVNKRMIAVQRAKDLCLLQSEL